MRETAFDILIRTAPEKIMAAFTTPQMLQKWWGVEKTFIELKEGGLYTLAWGISAAGIQYISTGIIRVYQPGQELLVGDYMYLSAGKPFLGPMELSLRISPSGSATRLQLRQGPYPENAGSDWDWYFEAVLTAWPQVLQKLKDYLEGL